MLNTFEIELRKRTMGMTLGFSKFFEPNEKFVAYMKKHFAEKVVFDVGAGAGHVSAILSEKGIKTIALDLHIHSNPEFAVLTADAATFKYTKRSVVMICRPCHGNFVEQTIERAKECKASVVLYIGLHRNMANDLGDFADGFEEVATKVGNDGESIWRYDIG